ncbi:MAG: MFS transporter, partial [Oligoflexus sp.]
ETLRIPYETAGLFLTVGAMTAVIATLLLEPCLHRWGERKVAIATCWLSMTPGFLAPFVDGRWSLLLLGVLLGAAVATIGSMCSILTIKGSPTQNRGRYLSFQQVMYGVGSMTAPLAFRGLVALELPWWWLLTGSSAILLLLGLAFVRMLPQEAPPTNEETRSQKQGVGLSGVLMVLLFALYVAGEVLASMWMSSLMVAKHGKTPAEAATLLSIFFVMMGLTRFLCFLFVRPRHEAVVLVGCVGLAIVFSFLGQQGYSWALPAMGILGPFFPLCMARISVQFPENWKKITIYVYGGIQTMLAIMHLSVGKLSDQIGIDRAFLLSPAFLLVAFFLLLPTLRRSRETSGREAGHAG